MRNTLQTGRLVAFILALVTVAANLFLSIAHSMKTPELRSCNSEAGLTPNPSVGAMANITATAATTVTQRQERQVPWLESKEKEGLFTVYLYVVWFDMHSETFYSYVQHLCDPSPEKEPIWRLGSSNVEFYLGPQQRVSEPLRRIYEEHNQTSCGPIFFGTPADPNLTVHTTTYPSSYDANKTHERNNVRHLVNSTKDILICHEHADMPELETSTNVFFLTPAHQHHIVPWHFPPSFVSRRIKPVKPVFLIQGQFLPKKRNFGQLLRTLELYQNKSFTIRIMGSAKALPPECDPHLDKIEIVHKPDALCYVLHMIDAHAVLPFVDCGVFEGHYQGGKKLTSSLLWGRGFGMKMVVYDKLAELFDIGPEDAYKCNKAFPFEVAFGKALDDYDAHKIQHKEWNRTLRVKKVVS